MVILQKPDFDCYPRIVSYNVVGGALEQGRGPDAIVKVGNCSG